MDEKETNKAADDVQYADTGETNTDEPLLEDVEENSNQKIKTLRDKLKSSEAEKAAHLEELQRAKADFLNSKKRLEEQRLLDQERSLASFIESLLPLCDSFDMAFANEAAWDGIDDAWRQGIEGIKAQLDSVLKKHKVEKIEALGHAFDPESHEAVSSRDDEKESDTVLEVLQTGYQRNGTVIRPAKVIIQS